MPTSRFALALCGAALFGAFTTHLVGTLSATAERVGRDGAASGASGEIHVLEPIRHENLALYPIVRTGGGGDRRPEAYVTLEEGLASGEVAISETGVVNALTIRNRGNRTLFVLAGEMVIGGKQDRIIGANQRIDSGETRSVPAFCVEHGRWDGGSRFEVAPELVHRNLRRIAQSGRGQQAVWAEVSETNARLSTSNGTDSYRHKFRASHAQELQDQYLRVLAPALAGRPSIVGFCVAINGELQTAEVYRDGALFERLCGKLLRSYAIDAIRQRGQPQSEPPSAAEAATLLDRVRQMSETATDGHNRTLKSPGYVAFESRGADGCCDHMTAELDK